MNKKGALSDEEIILGVVLCFEGGTLQPGQLTELYGNILPEVVSSASQMLANVENCMWTKEDFRGTILRMSLDYRLSKFAQCAFTAARNVPDAWVRAKQALIIIEREKIFRRKEVRRLEEELLAIARGTLENCETIRNASDKSRVFDARARETLRRRAAMSRAERSEKPSRAALRKNRLARDADTAIREVCKELFSSKTPPVNALAIRIVKNRVQEICPESVDDEAIRRALCAPVMKPGGV
ncbi:MAG: hypothetical protein Q4D04_10760 [Clostridia bacterium]|nr:hypothetical protein [Clostridia bacterium]